MVSIQGGRLVPLSFHDMREPGTGRTRVRMVDIESEGYRVAREYMIRLEEEDFKDPAWVEKLALAASMTVDEFQNKFGYIGS